MMVQQEDGLTRGLRSPECLHDGAFQDGRNLALAEDLNGDFRTITRPR